MTDLDLIRRAVLARPGDVTPRLVYADWLDDRGDPGDAEWAEFIRVQCELAAAAANPLAVCSFPATRCNTNSVGQWAHAADCPLGELRRRERELRTNLQNWWRWVEPIQAQWPSRVLGDLDSNGFSDDYAWGCRFRRGFVDELRVPTLDVLLGGACGRCGPPHGPKSGRVWAGQESPGYDENEYTCATCGRSSGVYGHYAHGRMHCPEGECPECAGTGRAPGIVAAVFAAHPVTRVVVADLEPDLSPEAGYVWWRSDLPDGVYDLLPASLGEKHGAAYVLEPNSRDAALDALSAALLAWAKRDGLV